MRTCFVWVRFAFVPRLLHVCTSSAPYLHLATRLHTLATLGHVASSVKAVQAYKYNEGRLIRPVYIPHFAPPKLLGGAMKTLHNLRIHNTKTRADFLAAYCMIAHHAHITITGIYLGIHTKINTQSYRQFYRTEYKQYTHEDYQHNEVTSIAAHMYIWYKGALQSIFQKNSSCRV